MVMWWNFICRSHEEIESARKDWMDSTRFGEACHERGLGLGIAILGSVGTAVYRSEVSDTLPAALPADAASRVQDTIGSAVYEAGRLPGELGTTSTRPEWRSPTACCSSA
ncbi:hypothetical protein AB0R12_04650 [Streptomyces niveus]|uniref:hypothetical protein n=1 Tax=Streptomyces niveus TaxID=193462 RepID=UPI0034239CE6